MLVGRRSSLFSAPRSRCGPRDAKLVTAAPCPPQDTVTGLFQRKDLQLVLLQVDDRGRARPGEPLGSITINLADYVGDGGMGTRHTFPLACNPAIVAVVGQPVLWVTLR